MKASKIALWRWYEDLELDRGVKFDRLRYCTLDKVKAIAAQEVDRSEDRRAALVKLQ